MERHSAAHWLTLSPMAELMLHRAAASRPSKAIEGGSPILPDTAEQPYKMLLRKYNSLSLADLRRAGRYVSYQ